MDTQEFLTQLNDNHSGVARVTGVYVLYKTGNPVYVGQAIDVIRRVYFHVAEGSKDFDSYSFIPTPASELNDLEAHLIVTFNPMYNQSLPPNSLYASLMQIKGILGVDKRTLNKLKHKHGIRPVWMDVYAIQSLREALEAQ